MDEKSSNAFSFDLSQPVIKSYLFYVSVLVLKTLFMSALTGLPRFRKKVFASSEDATFVSKVLRVNGSMVKYDDEDVERVRRAHLNDLENIPTFILCGFVYILTKPDEMLALNLFRIFTICRFIHTFVYAVVVIPQPARALSWGIAYSIAIYMAVKGIVHFFSP